MNEKIVLQFDPFEGDFGSPFDKRLKDKIVINRKDNICTHCGQAAKKGDKSRVITEIFDGQFESYRFCQACCEAMEAWEVKGDYETYEERRMLND